MSQPPMTEIPWTEIGAFGSFTLIVLFIALYFLTKWRKAKNGAGGTINKARCINDARLQEGLMAIAMTKESTSEMKQDMKGLTEKTVVQTGILRNLVSETKKQTQALEKVCSKMARQ